MANTLREQIILKILARLATITVANGYNTGMGANVHRCRRVLDPGSDLPAVVVWPLPETASRTEYNDTEREMPFRIEGLVVHGSTTPSVVVEQILGDLEKCLCITTAEATWTGGLTEDIEYTGGGTDEYPAPDETVTSAYANFTVRARTDLGDPYTQQT